MLFVISYGFHSVNCTPKDAGSVIFGESLE